MVNAPIFFSFTLLFIFVQQVKAEEKKIEKQNISNLLEYRTFRLLHMYKVILMSLLMWISTQKMNTFYIIVEKKKGLENI